mgnify:CR=1 FL=1
MLAKMSTVTLASFECKSSCPLTRSAPVLLDRIMWLFLNVVLDLYRNVLFCLEGRRTVANLLMPDIQGFFGFMFLINFTLPSFLLYHSISVVIFFMDENPVIIGLY